MEKQYIGLTDPGQIINTLCVQLATTQYLLDTQTKANKTLIGENATLRSENDRLQKALDENAEAYPERQEQALKVGDRVFIKYCKECDRIIAIDEREGCEVGGTGEPLRYRTGKYHLFDMRGDTTCWFSSGELTLASEVPAP